MPNKFIFWRLSQQWFWLVLTFLLCFVAGFWWGWHQPKPLAALRWQAVPGNAGIPVPEGALVTTSPRLVFGAMAQEIRSARFLENALEAAGQPASTRGRLQHLQLQTETAPDSLLLRLLGDQEPAAQAILQAIARSAQAFASGHLSASASESKNLTREYALADSELHHAKTRVEEFNRANQVLDLDREIASVQQQCSDTSLKIDHLSTELQGAEARIKALSDETGRQNPALAARREALQEALARYTEEHPKVLELRAAVAKLEAESPATNSITSMSLTTNNPALPLHLAIIEQRAMVASVRRQVEALEGLRTRLAQRLADLGGLRQTRRALEAGLQAAQETAAQIQARLAHQSTATAGMPVYVIDTPRLQIEFPTAALQSKHALVAGAGTSLVGGLLGAFLLALWQRRRITIQSERELEYATAVPIIAKLENLRDLSKLEKQRWALETFSVLKGRADGNGQNALICGFTAGNRRAGTSTCVELLAAAAKKQGYFTLVLDLSRKPAKTNLPASATEVVESAALPAANELIHALERPLPGRVVFLNNVDAIWSWQFRKQFQEALVKWNQADNLAVFVDLPPYSTEEGVVLGDQLPNLVWCCRCGQSTVSETYAHMNTLKNSHRNLIGTVFNQAKVGRRRKSNRWKRAAAAVFAVIFAAGTVIAQQPTNSPPAAVQPAPGLSVSEQNHLAPWQERLTLGPGDVLDISLYGTPDSARPGVVIGPDGRINYLQARDILASDLTVDELRAALEQALAKYHLAPKVVINPMAYNSKKYYILGNVMRKGGYLLDRPTTVIEAIAKSGGFVTALQSQNAAVLVDLERSFLVRKNEDGSFGKVPVNFESLFQRGDLTQNVPLAPGDYLFFPEQGRQEIYVVGEVRSQGIYPFTKDLTALGAVVAKGGFTEHAWKSKILIIRGSLSNPQTIVIDGGDILKAKGKDFQLQNQDIVYVHRKPWAKAQEILEYGVTSFFRAAVIGYTGINVGPFIKNPIIK